MASDPRALTKLEDITDELWEEILRLQDDTDERAFLMRQRLNSVRRMAGLPELTRKGRTG